MMNVIAMDHIVLNVHDMDTMLDFYINVLGLAGERIEAFGEGKVPFPSVRISEDTLIDLFPMSESSAAPALASKRLNHFCMVIEPMEMPQVIAGIDHVVGQVTHIWPPAFGRRGTARRAFFRRSHTAKEKRHGTPCPYRWPTP